MNFDDRLRNHLEAQTRALHVEPEGSDAVRARARRRRQQRTGGMVMATLLVALVAGAWITGRSDRDAANLATEGEPAAEELAADEATATIGPASASSPADDLDTVLPEPGEALVLTTADNTDAPGGYNVYQSGRTRDLYYVLSTAPGVTWDNAGDELIRNDTIYTFDGSTWSNTSVGDRFISTLDAGDSGLLYTISTGSPTSQSLELGTSANGGKDWMWTELDLTPLFGADRATWPAYAVQTASHGAETLVVVHARPQVDPVEAASLARANGADIDPDASEIAYADADGIAWYENTDVADPCQDALGDSLDEFWSSEPGAPEFEFDEDVTPEQQAELDAYWAAQEARFDEAMSTALDAVARVPGCATFVKCTTQYQEFTDELEAEFREFHDGLGLGDEDEELDDETLAQLDAFYEEQQRQIEAWVSSSGCGEALPWLVSEVVEGVTDVSSGYRYATWEELGVDTPEDWRAMTAGFLVENDQVAALGEPFGDQSGFLAAVRSLDGVWAVTFDESTYDGTETSSAFATWTSADGVDWTSNPTSTFDWTRPSTMSNGMSLSVDWASEEARLVRRSPNGADVALTLDDLAGDLDTSGYALMNVRAGDYGAVAWAVRWQDDDSSPYDSIVLYSPDGVGWGATEVAGQEVVDVIVGADEVVLFLNDPARGEGVPQPIVIGQV